VLAHGATLTQSGNTFTLGQGGQGGGSAGLAGQDGVRLTIRSN
jgi:hypothetical protein